jgi:hypothetical protein
VEREVEKVRKYFFLEVAVDVAAEVWEANGAVSEVRKRGRGVEGREMGGKEGGAGGAEEGALVTGWVGQARRCAQWARGRWEIEPEELGMPWVARKMKQA